MEKTKQERDIYLFACFGNTHLWILEEEKNLLDLSIL